MEAGGTHFQKWRIINSELFDQFCDWKDKKIIVHDQDLHDAAILIAENINCPDFKVKNSFKKFQKSPFLGQRKMD